MENVQAAIATATFICVSILNNYRMDTPNSCGISGSGDSGFYPRDDVKQRDRIYRSKSRHAELILRSHGNGESL